MEGRLVLAGWFFKFFFAFFFSCFNALYILYNISKFDYYIYNLIYLIMFFNVDIVLNLCNDVFGFHIGQIPRLTTVFSLEKHYDCKVTSSQCSSFGASL